MPHSPAPTRPAAPARVLSRAAWHQAREEHGAAARARIAGHRARRARGEKHPIEDFLWVYYTYSPTALTRWSPGADVRLEDAAATTWPPFFRTDPDGSVMVDTDAWWAQHGRRAARIRAVAQACADAPPSFSCFGLHEWAMVYRSPADRRHDRVPLRLSQADTDDVVRSLPIRCTHFDAFRFFTPDARPLNDTQLTRDHQVTSEQPGCVHAGMDLYRFAYQMFPIVSGDFVLRCFDHALRARTVDMRASPYDLTDFGLEPIRVETPAGRADYVAAQRELVEAARPLRTELLTQIPSS